ncbi:MAG: peptidylprolyl isomerase [Hyphomicrobiales bacterium]|nr:MAG: peptidylprolyl isomerase [Hyphomicrobiales bacterium]
MAIVAAAVFGVAVTAPSASVGQETKPHLLLTLKDGTVDIELLPEVAPLHIERIVALTNEGAYDNVLFHRVIDGFMAQTGDVQFGKEGGPEFNPAYAGMGGSALPNVKAEFNATSFTRGVVGAARTNDPDTFNSQWFICFNDCTFLDGQYTVFGKVVSGMEFVDNITRGEPPTNPDKIISAKIEQK